jgi:glycosyltransferase involved in cell wall biosynthesis
LDALGWLSEIAIRLPEARFTVAGSGDADAARALLRGAANVEVIGRADDVGALYMAHDALVVPLRMGGGSRLKILEASAYGTVIVSSTVGAEGLGLRPGLEYCCADDTEAWVRCIRDLASDPESGLRLARAARKRLEHLNWPAISSDLAAVVGELGA